MYLGDRIAVVQRPRCAAAATSTAAAAGAALGADPTAPVEVSHHLLQVGLHLRLYTVRERRKDVLNNREAQYGHSVSNMQWQYGCSVVTGQHTV